MCLPGLVQNICDRIPSLLPLSPFPWAIKGKLGQPQKPCIEDIRATLNLGP